MPMTLVQYLIGELSYGGRLISQEDKDVLAETVKHFINQQVVDKSGTLTGYASGKQFQTKEARKLYDLAARPIGDEVQQHFHNT